MKKDFLSWHSKKEEIEEMQEPAAFIKSREVWWCSIGLNIGVEVDGKNEDFERPAVVFRVFGKDMVWIIPLVSREENDRRHYTLVDWSTRTSAVVSQIRIVSTKRLLRKIGVLSMSDFQNIRKLLADLI